MYECVSFAVVCTLYNNNKNNKTQISIPP